MRRLILLFVIFLSFTACQKDTTGTIPDEKPVQDLWPLKVGNNWTYHDIEFGEDGAILDSFTYKLIVTDSTTINNKTYFILASEFYLEDTLSLVRSDTRAAYIYVPSMQKEFILFRWPATEGETLYTETYDYGRDVATASTQVFQINTFDSYRVTISFYPVNSSIIASYSELYFKPGVGMTGTRDYDTKENTIGLYQWYDSKLLSYELK